MRSRGIKHGLGKRSSFDRLFPSSSIKGDAMSPLSITFVVNRLVAMALKFGQVPASSVEIRRVGGSMMSTQVGLFDFAYVQFDAEIAGCKYGDHVQVWNQEQQPKAKRHHSGIDWISDMRVEPMRDQLG